MSLTPVYRNIKHSQLTFFKIRQYFEGSLSIVGVEEKEKTNEEGVCGAPHAPSSLVS